MFQDLSGEHKDLQWSYAQDKYLEISERGIEKKRNE